MRQMIREIEKETQSYRDMINDFKLIANDFRKRVSIVQTEASKLRNRLQMVNSQLELIIDELLDFNEPGSSTSKVNEINFCLEIIKDLS